MNTASYLMPLGLEKSIIKMYDSVWSYFTSSGSDFSVSVMPVNIPMICAFIVHRFKSHKMQPSIKAFVADSFKMCRFFCMQPAWNPGHFASSSMAKKRGPRKQ